VLLPTATEPTTKEMALIITGFQRSGKSLLRKLCNSHPEIRLTDGFNNFKKLNVPFPVHLSALRGPSHKRPLKDSVGKSPLHLLFRNGRFMVRYFTRLFTCGRWVVSVDDVETTLRSVLQASVVGDVYGQYIYILRRLAKLPNLKLAIIYRDCRDATSAFLKTIRKNPRNGAYFKECKTIERVAAQWVQAIENMQQHAENVNVIRYEELVTDPRKVVEMLGAWLGVDPHKFQYGKISSAWIGEHRESLSQEEIARIVSVAGTAMKALRYL